MHTVTAVVNNQLCAGVPIQNRDWSVAIVGLVFVPVAIICVALRCYSRYSTLRVLGYDDWMIVTAAVCLIAVLGLALQSALSL